MFVTHLFAAAAADVFFFAAPIFAVAEKRSAFSGV